MFVAALLHYLFTTVFFWMLCEGIMLYLMLVLVFNQLFKKWWIFFIIGWGKFYFVTKCSQHTCMCASATTFIASFPGRFFLKFKNTAWYLIVSTWAWLGTGNKSRDSNFCFLLFICDTEGVRIETFYSRKSYRNVAPYNYMLSSIKIYSHRLSIAS